MDIDGGAQDDLRAKKSRLRAEALSRRDAMGVEARIEASLAVADLLGDTMEFDPGTIVSGFLPIRSEIDLRPLMARLADRGARLCVPAIVGGELEFRQLVRGEPLVPQGFGTLAPGEGAAVLDPLLMLVPLSAFDARCHRIGYGRGYYDRAITRLRDKGVSPRLVGVAFAVQEVETVPTEAHDVALDLIATEAGIRHPA
ncbi:5-formyltetrahydrofolate cyclo-ligase [Aureimonas sp. Leaf454]|uniref:5-formyltetrahydrofolate cyclo-ligase n=1 Tax=Aureimonas sp. Leaf454 TaxID=1736381 RepID=UPI0006FA933F|nr:5-formyltetrahydrofolate cyclo-ligase [Aureimonas sp. Leaf454]KQT54354.1 5-formyltetrahydrofolate cyclo-ligase [Aureimonas sp. Leaf454]